MSRVKLTVLAVLFSLNLLRPVVADTSIYRCVTPAGQVSFQHTLCSHAGYLVEMGDTPSGWTGLRDGERSLLQTYRERDARQRARATAAKAEHGVVETRACWNKRRRLEVVNASLRRGYKPASGEPLRRRRDDYEAYLEKFCP